MVLSSKQLHAELYMGVGLWASIQNFNVVYKILSPHFYIGSKIEEVMKTEEHYLRDLNLCMQVFNSEQGEKVCRIC